MASLVPADFDLTSLEKSEQRVAQAFLDRLDDEWLVVPHVPIRASYGDAEIDIVLASPTRGVLVVEVKGGIVSVEAGQWLQYGHKIDNPFEQVVPAKHALVRHLKRSGVDMSQMWAEHVVALPDITDVPAGGLGPDAKRDQVFGTFELEDPLPVIQRLQRASGPVAQSTMEALVKALRPDITLSAEQGRYFEQAKRAIDATTQERLSSARSLDANRRVLVEGGAGTGKTWLVADWARRAAGRGERTAVVCFNRPIADRLAGTLRDTGVTVDTYHGLAVRLLEPFGFAPPAEPDAEFWRNGLTATLGDHGDRVGRPFDTIIVDEAQDLRPEWLDSLRALLEPGDGSKLLMVMDPAQAIYVDEWADASEFFRMTLDVNLRNSRAIGELCARLGGPKVLQDNPDGRKPEFIQVGGAKELRKRVRDTIARLMAEDGVPASQIAVLTTHTDTRDQLIAEIGGDVALTRWEDRAEGSVLCETIHRTKGLEWTAVIIATLDDPVDPQLLYIGASRPRMHLTLVGGTGLAAGLRGHR